MCPDPFHPFYQIKARADKALTIEELTQQAKKLQGEAEALRDKERELARRISAARAEIYAIKRAHPAGIPPKQLVVIGTLEHAISAYEAEKRETADSATVKEMKAANLVAKATQIEQEQIGDGVGRDAALAKLKQLNKVFDRLITELTTFTNGSTGLNALTSYLRGEALHKALSADSESYWLQVELLKAGGNNRIRRNFFDLFLGDKLSHSGGSIVGYTMYALDGPAKSFGVCESYLDYRSARQIAKGQATAQTAKVVCGQSENNLAGAGQGAASNPVGAQR
jgi:hypothetical protein